MVDDFCEHFVRVVAGLGFGDDELAAEVQTGREGFVGQDAAVVALILVHGLRSAARARLSVDLAVGVAALDLLHAIVQLVGQQHGVLLGQNLVDVTDFKWFVYDEVDEALLLLVDFVCGNHHKHLALELLVQGLLGAAHLLAEFEAIHERHEVVGYDQRGILALGTEVLLLVVPAYKVLGLLAVFELVHGDALLLEHPPLEVHDAARVLDHDDFVALVHVFLVGLHVQGDLVHLLAELHRRLTQIRVGHVDLNQKLGLVVRAALKRDAAPDLLAQRLADGQPQAGAVEVEFELVRALGGENGVLPAGVDAVSVVNHFHRQNVLLFVGYVHVGRVVEVGVAELEVFE
mmetsp:Transcript_34792/g.75991  ORF Transcript_34792/g.75991 Transcript_34792/m.75991 type:complete len:346 (-) Transcript_34792:1000-2037(-)